MLEELRRLFAARESFAFETTLAGRGYARSIREWQGAGYRVKLMFLQLDRVETAIECVALRVAQGGHHIPEAVIRRRFVAGRANFEKVYSPIVDEWGLYDASRGTPRLLARKT